MRSNSFRRICGPTLLMLACSLPGNIFRLAAQNTIHPPLPAHIRQLDTRDGLADDIVNAITTDSLGFWWIATNDGLQRFDGRSFLTFRHATYDSTSLPDNQVLALSPTADNGLWVATADELCRYDSRSHRFTPARIKGRPIVGVYPASFFTDSYGIRWMVTTTVGGLYRLLPGATEWEQLEMPPLLVIGRNVVEDVRTGDIWFSTYQGLASWERRSGRVRHPGTDPDPLLLHLNFPGITNLQTDQSGNLWVQTIRNGNQSKKLLTNLYKCSLSDREITPVPSYQDFGEPFLRTRDGRIWFYSIDRYSLLALDPASLRLDQYPFSADSVHLDNRDIRIRCMHEDREGNLWIGTAGGVFVFSGHRNPIGLTTARRNSDFMFFPLSIFETDRNEIWVGTFFNGIHVYDNALRLLRKIIHPDDHNGDPIRTERNYNAVWAFCEDQAGNLWAGGQHGTVRCFRPDGTLLRQWRPDSLRNHTIRTMERDREGYLWIGTHNGLLARMDPADGRMRIVHDMTKINPLAVKTLQILPDPDADRLWVIGSDRLLDIRKVAGTEGQESWNTVTYPAPTGIGYHVGLELSADSLLLFGEGIHLFNKRTGTVTRVPASDKLPNQIIYGAVRIAPDSYLLALMKGMAVWHPSKQVAYPLGHRSAGLGFEEVAQHNFRLLRDGRLLFGSSIPGLYSADTAALLAPPRSLDLVITDLRIQDQPLRLPDDRSELVLPRGYNLLTIKYACLTWNFQDQIGFRYRLHGYSPDWVDNGSVQSLTLAGLAPGRYRLDIQAVDPSGMTASAIRSVLLYLPPPWYLGWPARILYAGLVVLSVLAVYRFQWKRRTEQAETRRIQELERFKSRFYTNITHEFRTPLTLISGMAENIRSNPDRWHSEGLDMIRNHSRRLLQLVNQLLELSRLENGILRHKPVQQDIVPTLKFLFDSFVPAGQVKGLDMRFLPPADSLVMDFDAEFLQPVISNLLSNSLKFTPSGGTVSLTAELSTKKGRLASSSVRPSAKRQGNYLSICIADTGIGIEAEQLPFVFDRFFRGKTAAGLPEGSGIGLSIARELAKAMGGELQVRSESGKGTVFELRLPVTREAPLAPPAPMAVTTLPPQDLAPVGDQEAPPVNAATHTRQPGSNPSVPLLLLVEDHPDMARYTAACLDNRGYQLLTATDGLQALNLAGQQIPDLIILDVMLPGLDGFEVCHRLKSDEKTAHIPILMLTALADRDSRLQGARQGADLYLEKPFDPEELTLQIDRLLALRRLLQRHYRAQAGLETAREAKMDATPIVPPTDPFIEKVLESIHAQLSNEGYSVEQLSREVFVSPAQLNRKLNALLGIPAGQLIRHVRLQTAERLLSDPQRSVASIALECGFGDASYFSRLFKQARGMRPAEWRKKALSERTQG